MSIEDSARIRIHADRIIKAGEKSRQKFLKTTPPLTWIWQDETKHVFGKTIGDQRVYIDPNDDFVAVNSIQENKNLFGLWNAKDTIPLTQREIGKIHFVRH